MKRITGIMRRFTKVDNLLKVMVDTCQLVKLLGLQDKWIS